MCSNCVTSLCVCVRACARVHVGHSMCKQCNREHAEHLASVFPIFSLPDRA